jgi:hypothetical protein
MAPKFRGPSGIIGIIAQETARYTDFWQSIFELTINLPAQWETRITYGYDTIFARNKTVAEFLEAEREGGGRFDYLVFMDDDHNVPRNLISHLLSHEKDVVAPLCLKRYPPFRPTAHIDGKVIRWEGEQGLIEVDSTGCPGMLIHRKVFEETALEYEHDGQLIPYWFRGGQVYPDRMAEDTDFCYRVREAGFKIHVDLSAGIGHYTTACVLPRDGKPWFAFGAGAEYQMGGTFNYGQGAPTYPLPGLKAVS